MIKGKGAGLSLVVSLGHYAGLRVQFNREIWRVVIGWVAVELCFFDMDYVFGLLTKDIDTKERGGE